MGRKMIEGGGGGKREARKEGGTEKNRIEGGRMEERESSVEHQDICFLRWDVR